MRLVLDFVDYGTPERRRAMCREEVRLNRRLAPDVYIGVRGVARTADGVELTADERTGRRPAEGRFPSGPRWL